MKCPTCHGNDISNGFSDAHCLTCGAALDWADNSTMTVATRPGLDVPHYTEVAPEPEPVLAPEVEVAEAVEDEELTL